MMTPVMETRVGRGSRHVGLIAAGVLAALLAVALLAAGGLLLWAHGTKRDADGFYRTSAKTLVTPTYALVSDGLDVGTDGPNWLFHRGRLGTVRVTATGTRSHPVFVGIGPKPRVASYLDSVAHDNVTDFEVDPFSVTCVRHSGRATPAVPVGRTFWAVEASGSGRQTVTWPAQKGSWAVVVMNADGSRGVQAKVSVGAKLPLLFWLAIGLLGAGVVAGGSAGAAVFFGSRARRTAQVAASPA